MIKPGVESSFRDQHTLERRIRIRQEGEQQGYPSIYAEGRNAS